MGRVKSVTAQSKKGKKNTDADSEGSDGNPEFEVESILGVKNKGGKTFYWLKWKGFPLDEATWEPKENAGNIENLLKKFEAEQDEKKQTKSKAKDEQSPQKTSSKKTSSVATESKKIKKVPKPKQAVTVANKKDAVHVRNRNAVGKGNASKKKSADSEIGRFEDDVASKISGHGVFDPEDVMRNVKGKAAFDQIFFRVEWKKRNDNVQPTSTFYPYKILKEQCPQVLLEYVETLHCAE